MTYARQPTSTPGTCRHCKQDRTEARWRRGLCRRCYGDPAIRARYGQRGSLAGLAGESTHERDFDLAAPTPPAPAPVTAWPGTEAKVAVLVGRARLGQALWHPLDPTCFDAKRFDELSRPVGLPPARDPASHRLVEQQVQLRIADLFARLPGKKAVAALAASLGLKPADLFRGHVFLTDEEE